MNVFLSKYILRSSTSSVFLKIMKSTCTPKKGPDMFQMAAKDISGLGSLADLQWARSGFPERVVSLGTKFFPYFIIIGWWVVTSTDMRPINWPVTQHSVTKTTTIVRQCLQKLVILFFYNLAKSHAAPTWRIDSLYREYWICLCRFRVYFVLHSNPQTTGKISTSLFCNLSQERTFGRNVSTLCTGEKQCSSFWFSRGVNWCLMTTQNTIFILNILNKICTTTVFAEFSHCERNFCRSSREL